MLSFIDNRLVFSIFINVNLTYKYCLKLTQEQRQRVDSWMGACRLVHNLALEIKIDAYRKNIPLSFYDLKKQLPDLRRDIDWIGDVPSDTLADVILSLDVSYSMFLKKKAGFPKFKSKKKSNHIFLANDQRARTIRLVGNKEFRLPKLGNVKVFKSRLPVGRITNGIITKEAGKYYLSISCRVDKSPLPVNENQVGIDVGIANFAVLSDGTFIEHPRITFKYAAELRRQQRKLARCKYLSKNWYKQKLVVQKLHQKIKRTRLDFLHKLSTNIVNNYGMAAVENLNVAGMIKSTLSTHISDSGWSTFKTLLKYKSELYGRTFFEVPAQYSSQECNKCGHTAKENRQSQSIFVCSECGFQIHADLGASKNLLGRGQRLLAQSTDASLRLAKEVA